MVYSICSVPPGWIRHIHPEGQPYYIKTLDGRTYITESDVTKPKNLDTIQREINDMGARISTLINDLPKAFLIYLEHLSTSEAAYYYMVNHDQDRRCVFWIDTLDLHHYISQDLGLHSLSFEELHILNEYGLHCTRFPHCFTLDIDLIKELSGILMYLIAGTPFVHYG